MPVPAALFCLFLLSTPTSLQPYVGEYVLVPEESADVRKVIEQAASGFNFILRPIARGRLRKTQVAFPAVRIQRNEDEFRITLEKGTDVTYKAVDEPVRTTAPDGGKIVVRLLPGPPLSQTYESDEGVRIDRFLLSEDGSKLTIDVHVTSPHLKKPINYQLVYRRTLRA
jgi:hypothetical protein